MGGRLRIIQIGLAWTLSGCAAGEWSTQSVVGTEFCVAFPTAAECNGGTGSPEGAQFSVLTTSGDGVIRMTQTNSSNPDQGSGFARINIRNSSMQNMSETLTVDFNNLPVTLLVLCPRTNDSMTTCPGNASAQTSLDIPAGATGGFLIRVEADGTIPFVPVVNAIFLRIANSNPVISVKIPIANEK